jgi:hypothetical protein
MKLILFAFLTSVYQISFAIAPTYSCTSGWSLNGTNCEKAATVSGSYTCYTPTCGSGAAELPTTCGGTTSGLVSCYCYNPSAGWCSPPVGSTRAGTCTSNTCSSYSCLSGGTVSGNKCTQPAARSCAGGYPNWTGSSCEPHADSYRITKSGGSKFIVEHGLCSTVTNNKTDYDLFVPTKTSAEFSQFRSTTTTGVIKNNSTCPVL